MGLLTEKMFRICCLLVVLIAQDCSSQDEDEGPYKGKLIGKFNSYHHQVSGDVYAVDDWTLLLVNLNYDGAGDDAYFWAGDSGRPGPQGFIIPDEHGKTNVLEKYYNAEIRITLPEGKRVSRLKWVSVYDLSTQNSFADVFVPEELVPPAPLPLAPLTPAANTNAVSSDPVVILDANTILIPGFKFDGSGSSYFWVGRGPQPSARGRRVPDARGYLEPLRRYHGDDVTLRLPAPETVFDIDWLAVYDKENNKVLASVLIPEAPNVPSGVVRAHPFRSPLPRCKQLHADYQVAWEVFGSQVTIQLAAKMDEDMYMGFGISGSETESRMVGADVAVAWYDPRLQQGHADDYNITDMAPCVQVLGAWRGVCPDTRLGGLDSNQVFSASTDDGITTVTYRRSLQPVEPLDLPWRTDRLMAVVWALGRRGPDNAPAFHDLYHKQDLLLNLTGPAHDNDCIPFTVGSRSAPPPWERAQLFDPSLRVFRFALGPAGGARGLPGRAPRTAPPPLALYVNGQLAPDIQLRRGLKYIFRLNTGSEPHSAREYHPVVVSASPRSPAPALAGVRLSRRHGPAPTAAGAACIAEHKPGADRRRDDDYLTFREFNRSLSWRCVPGQAADLSIAPNSSWPDLVYYHSFTHADMGGRIFIVDRHKRNLGQVGSDAAILVPATIAVLLALTALAAAR